MAIAKKLNKDIDIVSIYDSENDMSLKDILNDKDDRIAMLVNEYEDGEEEGTEIEVKDAINYYGRVQVKGNTYQKQLSGKNLLDNSTIEVKTLNGITSTYDKDTQEITFNGTCTKDNTLISFVNTNIIASASKTNFCAYCIDGSISGDGRLRFYDANYAKNCILYINELTKGNYTLKQANESYEAVNNNFRFNAGAVCNNFKIKVMVTDSTDTTYEPYCGGQASPNPDYPQEIKVVTGDNDIKHVGKNLFNYITNFRPSGNGLTNILNSDGSISVSGTPNSQYTRIVNQTDITDILKDNTTYTASQSIFRTNEKNVSIEIQRIRADESTSNVKVSKNSNKVSFTVDKSEFVKYTISFLTNTVQPLNFTTTLQLEEGTTLTPYEPYREEEYELSLGTMELCKIDDYQDILFKNVVGDENYNAELEDGAWYKKSAIAEVVLDGSEIWSYNSGNRYFYTNKFLDNYVTQYTKLVSNNYIGGMASNGDLYNNHIQTGTAYSIMLCDNRFTDNNDLKIWLSTHNTIVKYPLATTTYEKITNPTLISQLETLNNKFLLYKRKNRISTETDNLEPYLKLNYKKSNQISIEEDIEDIKQAIISMGGNI